ncbi:MAG: O-antigen ligase family protein [Candidatus Nanopelagicales bacterium]|nr:O-antigen ligase family protein [Candidatus Nanopelagicales bacterium]
MLKTQNRLSRLLQLPLVLILVMPLFYYPVSKSVLSPILTPFSSGLANVSITIIALGSAVLVLGSLAINMVTEKPRFGPITLGSVLRCPEMWGSWLVLWLFIITAFQPEPTSTQNLAAYLVSLAILFATRYGTGLVEKILLTVTVLSALVLSSAGLVGAFNYSVFNFVGSNPRVYAMYCVITVCMIFAVRIPAFVRVMLIASLYAAIVVSESRTAFVTALVVAGVGFTVTAKRPLLHGLGMFTGGVMVLAVTLSTPLISSRMAANEITSPGLSVNDSGRAVGWRVVIDSFLQAPLFGQGAGSGQTVALRDAWPIDHPHSEYLRILHDGGLVAGILTIIFVALLLWTLRPRIAGHVRAPIIVGGFLLIVAGLTLGTIENFIVFPSLMWPGALLVGMGLKQARKDQNPSNLLQATA